MNCRRRGMVARVLKWILAARLVVTFIGCGRPATPTIRGMASPVVGARSMELIYSTYGKVGPKSRGIRLVHRPMNRTSAGGGVARSGRYNLK